MAQITGDKAPAALGGTAAARPTVRAAESARPGRRPLNLAPVLFLAAPVALYLLWVIGPMFYTVYMSFTDSDGFRAEWIGLENYRQLFQDDTFRSSLWNNVRWLLLFITVPTAAGLGLALLLNNNYPGVRFIKAGIFSPMVLSSAVVAAVWTWMYFPQDGLINTTLAALGYGGKRIGWLADPDLAIYSVIGAAVWRQVGYVMLIYLAGLKNVDPSLVDAARVDGASPWRSFKDVVFPLLTPVTVIVVVVSIIDALRAFDLVQLMTQGGPYDRTNVLGFMMYEESFNYYKMGYGAAIAVVLMLISMTFIFTYLRRMLKDELEY